MHSATANTRNTKWSNVCASNLIKNITLFQEDNVLTRSRVKNLGTVFLSYSYGWEGMSWRWVVVKMTVYGHVVDPAFSRMLIQKTDLPLTDILCLDRIQKKLPVPVATIRLLRRCGLIEGRQPNIHVSADLADA